MVDGSGAVSGSCSGIVPGSAGMGSSGVGRSGVVPGSWLAISSSFGQGRPIYAAHTPQNVGRRACVRGLFDARNALFGPNR